MESDKPPRAGRYLALCFEWVGLEKDRPATPQWQLKQFDPVKGWERQRYFNDTGGYEQLEVIHWQELPAAVLFPKTSPFYPPPQNHEQREQEQLEKQGDM